MEIEYIIDDFWNEDDLDKRPNWSIEWISCWKLTGIGVTNGGSIGSGTMEVGCDVVDLEIARRVIERN